MKTKKQKPNKGISRIDSGSTHGWFVRAYRNGKTYAKLFSDKKLGGKKQARAAAIEYRDSLFTKISDIPKQSTGRRIVFKDARNTTGVLGVCRTKKRSPNGTVHECFSVSWRPASGVQKCTSFSIKKYGEKKAFEKAVSLRKKMMLEIHGPEILRKINTQLKPTKVKSGTPSLPVTRSRSSPKVSKKRKTALSLK
ncbi:MAG: hypothetical protein COZ46_07695 [Verrucomicrobia bacterium CG_4_10_14_3_um_filter_43_23]|nr:MAG: hypothetical protein AUJ82_03340 [Verrucomicrobia bacterium CG1_02_43_26]PIP59730.1 MAG: hypothetical protein COX01_02170 [Verrucomicrobia bacterium CG22_combo_CG10-13_8_21_14_all_43_17]PIX57742.1 MAG: hypothetical protein COZ46_07695 [Verrucomicrobia bacterium CG_4_10_14_3_um_filter_43_23]PIY62534.1 MAG: hypothetical protein COY94_01880 [Verrucomicrobia bacterium CG_4_10_14_0_8_um_filter_43_34]PJA44646.1 MAG: hypothetical protein CO175_01745 [Verrucomicrobia bacterium CG_4_9_14_3_um_fi